MTVKELIEQLQKCDQEKEVLVANSDGGGYVYNDPPEIEETKYAVWLN